MPNLSDVCDPKLLVPGAVVRLKSSNLPMVIADFDPESDIVRCCWIFRGRPFGARYRSAQLAMCEKWEIEDSFAPPAYRGRRVARPESGRTAPSRHGTIIRGSRGE